MIRAPRVSSPCMTSTAAKTIATPFDRGLAGRHLRQFHLRPGLGHTYTLDQSKADHLTDGQHVTDTLTVASFDGTASQPIVVNHRLQRLRQHHGLGRRGHLGDRSRWRGQRHHQ
ncbi:VCBS domain-containing protein [Bradyrhizobium sp. USDA 4519]